MEYRQLGGSGLKVPVLSFGTATFGGGTEFFKAWGETDVAEEVGKTIPQVALNWLIQRSVANVIIGARNEEQLRQNLEAVGWNLTREQVAKLDKVTDSTPIYPYWHQRQFASRNPLPVKVY